jgi:CO/xanthine dehydrogenase Mo-binding subunit
VSDAHRVLAEILGVPWERCDIIWVTRRRTCHWTCPSVGSQTTHAMTRAAHAAVGWSPRRKLQEIAAKDLGGKPEDYDFANERVFRKGGGPA